jgi:hypothetical protein
MQKLFIETVKVISFSLPVTMSIALGLCILPIPFGFLNPSLLLSSFAFAVTYAFGPILFFACLIKVPVLEFSISKRKNILGILAVVSCLVIGLKLAVFEKGSSEFFGPTLLTYFMLAQAALVSFATWKYLSGIFWFEASKPRSERLAGEHSTKLKVFAILFANLSFGNLILYIHEVGGRHQDQVDSNLWISFSAVALILLLLSVRILKHKNSMGVAFSSSLAISFLIPALGFFISMKLSLIALLMGMIYLVFGFYWTLPMVALNFIAFRWLQRSSRTLK